MDRTLIHTLDFCFEEHLSKISLNVHNKTVEEIQRMELAKMLQEIWYGSVDDDSIEIPEHLHGSFGVDTQQSIDNALYKMLNEASNNGMGGKNAIKKTSKHVSNQRLSGPICES